MSDRMRAMNWRLLSFGALAVLGAVVVVALGGERSGGRAEAAGRAPGLHAFGSCDRLRSYLSRHRAAFKPTGVEAMPGVVGEDDAAGSPAEAAPAPAPGSPTNVQEAGVDEPDIVKTAGEAILTVDGLRLRAVDSNGGSPVLLDSIELPGGPGQDSSADYQLLAAGDRLLAIGTSYGYPTAIEGDVGVAVPDVGVYGEPRTVVAEVDVSDPASMRVIESMTVDGSYVSARLTGSTVRLATSSYPTSPVAGRRNGRALLPDVRVRDHATGERTHSKLVGCRAVDRPSRFAGTGMLTV